MRETERIDETLARLGDAWRRQPDLRLGQLIYNAVAESANHPVDPFPDLFYIEDDVLTSALR
ncbi:DUF1040 family protein [Nocardioides caeni]|uniref:DUF1040 family protein n=1 Tax=Nocardioides caeni TaxID=574700 RepID=A0A4S8NLW9_9ACTN|nr:DUF1040 family protein [Nocardioides caeni]THV17970.1 DUF1040 family protein [Nocardioides caeni]